MGSKSEEITIIYEDNHLIVARKPLGVLSQEAGQGEEDMLTLIKKYLKMKYDKKGEVFLGLVHRLDRPVGGIMVFARTSKAASRLSKQIRDREFRKTYLAVVQGKPEPDESELRHFLLKDQDTNTVHVVPPVSGNGKEAILNYTVLETSGNLSLLKIELKTGRPHQIRVQLSHEGYPIYGDRKYGIPADNKDGEIALWSWMIALEHPTLKIIQTYKCNPPDEYPWIRFKSYME